MTRRKSIQHHSTPHSRTGSWLPPIGRAPRIVRRPPGHILGTKRAARKATPYNRTPWHQETTRRSNPVPCTQGPICREGRKPPNAPLAAVKNEPKPTSWERLSPPSRIATHLKIPTAANAQTHDVAAQTTQLRQQQHTHTHTCVASRPTHTHTHPTKNKTN